MQSHDDRQLADLLHRVDADCVPADPTLPTVATLTERVRERRHTRQRSIAGGALAIALVGGVLSVAMRGPESVEKAGRPVEASTFSIAQLTASLERIEIPEVPADSYRSLEPMVARVKQLELRHRLAETMRRLHELEVSESAGDRAMIARDELAAVRLAVAETYEQHGERQLALASYQSLASTDADSPLGGIAAQRVAELSH